jgi:hypothetical protein
VGSSARWPAQQPLTYAHYAGPLADDGDDVDWYDVAELLTESYCVLAPKKLVERARTAGF